MKMQVCVLALFCSNLVYGVSTRQDLIINNNSDVNLGYCSVELNGIDYPGRDLAYKNSSISIPVYDISKKFSSLKLDCASGYFIDLNRDHFFSTKQTQVFYPGNDHQSCINITTEMNKVKMKYLSGDLNTENSTTCINSSEDSKDMDYDTKKQFGSIEFKNSSGLDLGLCQVRINNKLFKVKLANNASFTVPVINKKVTNTYDFRDYYVTMENSEFSLVEINCQNKSQSLYYSQSLNRDHFFKTGVNSKGYDIKYPDETGTLSLFEIGARATTQSDTVNKGLPLRYYSTKVGHPFDHVNGVSDDQSKFLVQTGVGELIIENNSGQDLGACKVDLNTSISKYSINLPVGGKVEIPVSENRNFDVWRLDCPNYSQDLNRDHFFSTRKPQIYYPNYGVVSLISIGSGVGDLPLSYSSMMLTDYLYGRKGNFSDPAIKSDDVKYLRKK